MDANGCLTVESGEDYQDDAFVDFEAFAVNENVKSICFKPAEDQDSFPQINVLGTQYSLTTERFPNLESIKIDSKEVKKLSPFCFAYCGKLKSVDFSGSGITSLASSVFMECKSFTELDLTKTPITSLGANGCAFAGSCLTKIVLPEGMTQLSSNALSDGGQAQGKGTYGSAEGGISEIVVPSTVTSIGQGCFKYLKGLETVYVPSGLKSFNSSQEEMGYGTGSTSQTEIVVYGQDTLDDPEWVTALKESWRGTRTGMQNVQFAYPGSVIKKAAELKAALDADPTGAGISASDVLDLDAAYGLLTCEQVQKAGYSVTAADWSGIKDTIDAAWQAVLGSADASSMSASEKLAQVSEYLAKRQEAYDELKGEYEKAKADLSEAQRKYIAASEAASGVNSMKANYERQLEEAQAKVDEAAAKVAELEKQLDSDQSAAEAAAAKAEVVRLQDELAVRSYAASTKTVKLNKKGRTKAKSVVRLKLVKSASGAAVSCAKAKGTSKKVTVSDTGVVTLKKGVKKGAYKAVVTFTCGKATNTVTVTFKAA